MSWLVRGENLGKQYANGHWGVRHVSFELPAGAVVALIGANGAGKTTLIQLLYGVLRPSQGQCEIRARAENIGWSSQHPVIDWFLSVYDNVLLGARLAGFSLAESHIKTIAALKLVELESVREKQPDQLSGGQQQRLQIARALIHDPSIALLDEPTTGLDPEAAERLLRDIQSRARGGALMVISSHDLALLEAYCDLVIYLRQGQLVCVETKEQFLLRLLPEEEIEIYYEGNILATVLEALNHTVNGIVHDRPLRLRVSRGQPLAQVLTLLEGQVRIVDVHRHTTGLREALLKGITNEKIS